MTCVESPAIAPELLAPAGTWESLIAALGAGTDSVYFGLDDGFNARARAKNFGVEELPAIVRTCHAAGARAYLTLNTLVFEEELAVVEGLLRQIGASGVDALIVQDPAVCLIARRLVPELELHASTQMTISSPDAARFAERLGVTRIVVPRELSVAEIRTFRAGTALELEVFVHGALCMSWSGQCLTSEAWGGRSANRGQCAQSCRLPYDLWVDGGQVALGAGDERLRYLLSPRDLAGHAAVPELAAIGVHTLKIEGRLKGPAYVATTVGGLRRWLTAIGAGQHETPAAREQLALDLAEAERVYSRGFTTGFLGGVDHQTLVDGRYPKHRGALLGRVREVRGHTVIVTHTNDLAALGEARANVAPASPACIPARGMGVVFDGGNPEDTNEAGGPLFDVAPLGDGWRLTFGTPGPDLTRVAIGQRVWVNSDLAAENRAQRLVKAGTPKGRIGVTLTVSGRLGEPLRAMLQTVSGRARFLETTGTTVAPLGAATTAGLDESMLTDKLGALGGSLFHLAALDRAGLAEGLFVAPSELKALRRTLVAALEEAVLAPPARTMPTSAVVPELRAELAAAAATPAPSSPHAAPATAPSPSMIPLCRLDAHLDAAIALGLPEVALDWMELVGLGRAVERARAAGLRVTLATTRVQKPGEERIDQRLQRLTPDAYLVRHWGGLMAAASPTDPALRGHAVHGDFSLNVTNSLSANLLLGLGLATVTASHDLDEAQLFGLLAGVDPSRVAIVLHHHIPTFHTEHCVYAHTLSTGTDWQSCGRPCDRHRLSLRDPKGLLHPVITDVGCRNTVFEARAQSAAALVPRLLAAGVRHYRVELVRESQAEAETVLTAYRELLAGRLTPKVCTQTIGAHEQFGVVRGIATSARSP